MIWRFRHCCAVLWIAALLPSGDCRSQSVRQESPPATGRSAESRRDDQASSLENYFADKVFLLVEDFGRFSGEMSGADRIVVPLRQLRAFLERELTQARRELGGAGISSIDITGDLLESRAELRVAFVIQTSSPNAQVGLELREAICTQARTTSGRPAFIEKDVAGGFRATFPDAGSATLELDLSVDLTRTPSGRRLTLTLPTSAVKKAELRSVAPIVAATESSRDRPCAIEADRKAVRLALRADESIDLRWRTEQDGDPFAASGPTARSEITVRVLDAVIETNYSADLALAPGSDQATIDLPEADRLISLSVESGGAPVTVQRSTPPASGDKGVLIQFAERVNGPLRLKMAARRALLIDAPNADVGQVQFRGIARQEGVIRVEWTKNRPIRQTPTGSAVRAPTISGVDPAARQGIALFRYDASPAGISILCPKVQPTVAARCESTFVVGSRQTQLRSRLRATVRNGSIDSIRIAAPTNLERIEIGPGSPVVSRKASADGSFAELHVSFAEPTFGDIDLQLTGTIASAAEIERWLLPHVLDDPNGQCQATLIPEQDVEIALDEAESRNVARSRSMEGGTAERRNIVLRSLGGLATVSVRRRGLQFQTEASLSTSIRVAEDAAAVQTMAEIRADRDGLNSLVLELPASGEGFSAQVNDGPAIEDLVPGKNVVSLPEVGKSFRIAVQYRLKSSGAEKAVVPLPVFPDLKVSEHRATAMGRMGQTFLIAPPWKQTATAGGSDVAIGWSLSGSQPTSLEIVRVPDPMQIAGWAPVRETEVLLEETGDRRIRHRYALADLRSEAIRIRFTEDCRQIRTRVDGRDTVCRPNGNGEYVIELGTGGNPRSLEIAYSVSAAATPGVFERIETVYHRFLDRVPMGAYRLRVYTAPGRFAMPGNGNFEAGLQSGRELVRRLLGRKPAVAADYFAANGMRLSWAALDPLNAVPEDFRTWTFFGYADEPSMGEVRVAYEPFWMVLCSGAVVVAAGWMRRMDRRRRTLTAAGVALALLATASASPAFVGLAASGAVWGALYLVLIGAIRRWGAFDWQRFRGPRPRPSFMTRPGSSLTRPISSSIGSVSASERRVASTMDLPVARTGPDAEPG